MSYRTKVNLVLSIVWSIYALLVAAAGYEEGLPLDPFFYTALTLSAIHGCTVHILNTLDQAAA